jgi:hypothetical protein
VKHGDPVRSWLAALAPAPPAADLRARVVARALVARASPVQAFDDRWTTTLRNRPLRWAWVISLLLLIAAHAWINVESPRASGSAGRTDRAGMPLDSGSLISDLPRPIRLDAGMRSPGRATLEARRALENL